MKNRFAALMILLVLLVPCGAFSADLVAQGDKLFEQGTLDGYKAAVSVYRQALDADPDNYEAIWKYARACQNYGDTANAQQVEGWKKICAEYGKLGMDYGLKARDMKPESVEGHYFLGCCAGTYSDGVSIITLIKEGLLGTIQESLETSYDIDKTFDLGGPMQALATYWSVLPWPKNDLDKAERYARESMEIFPVDPAGQYILADILLKKNKKKNHDEAVKLFTLSSAGSHPVYSQKAKDRLAKL